MSGMEWLDAVQWPAMVVTVAASWFVASTQKRRRSIGFWLFLLSNVAWVAWGVHAHAWALITLQVCLAAMNVRGAAKASDAAKEQEKQRETDEKATGLRTAPPN